MKMAQWIFRKKNIWRCGRCKRPAPADDWADEELEDVCKPVIHIHRVVQCPWCTLVIDICEVCCVKGDDGYGGEPGSGGNPSDYMSNGT